ncbi:MAG TPA: DUF6457 domain-containing protein [Candidatus Dormibacteraeota bacterium]|nr:DUF6457 domain-containing protein [Candidatus Dormibacteraeota bacterium]
MNEWFDRYLKGLGAADAVLRPEEAKLVLDLAAESAHVSGARQYAPLAAYLAGRAAAGQSREGRIKVIQGAIGAATKAGPAGGDLGLELDS